MNDKIHPEFNQMKSSEKVKGFMIWSIVMGVLIWQMKRRSKNSDDNWSQSPPPATFGHFQMISYRTPNMICFTYKIHQKWQNIYESFKNPCSEQYIKYSNQKISDLLNDLTY